MPLFETQNLDVIIGDTLVCGQLELQIYEHQCWGILGRNGTGKTTLMHTFAGLYPAYEGIIRFDNHTLANYKPLTLARQLGILFQTTENHFPMTVMEIVLASRHPHQSGLAWESKEDIEIANTALDTVGLKGFNSRLTSSLSGGEYQRLQIAALLAQQPVLALLDEPSNHLDPGQQLQALSLLQQTFTIKHKASAMILHDVNLATRFCDHLLCLLGDGQWLAGPTSEIATIENLEKIYHHPFQAIKHQDGNLFIPR